MKLIRKKKTIHNIIRIVCLSGLIVCMQIVVYSIVAITVPQDVNGAIFNVTKTEDTADGTCDEDCSLREAIISANNNNLIHDTINIPAGIYTLNIRNAGSGEQFAGTGDLDIYDDLEIIGTGAGDTVIDGNDIDRIFHIWSNYPSGPRIPTVMIKNVTIRNGLSGEDDGGGILNSIGNTEIINCNVTDNINYASGAGIYNEWPSQMKIMNSFISDNESRTIFWIYEGGGGGIFNDGTMFIEDSTISNNYAMTAGGGIYSALDLKILNSTISHNTGIGVAEQIIVYGAHGGGVFNSGETNIINSTVSGNVVAGYKAISLGETSQGGGIYNKGILRATNSTLYDNMAKESLVDVDIDGDGVRDGREIIPGEGGGIFNSEFSGGTVQLGNNILAKNVAGEGANCFGVPTINGVNIVSDDSCNLQINDFANTDPMVDPNLANNGGSTLTHALLPGSPAIDAADIFRYISEVPDEYKFTDQRGINRQVDGDLNDFANIDIGAYEFEPVINNLVFFNLQEETFMSTGETTGCPDGCVGKYKFDAILENRDFVPFPDGADLEAVLFNIVVRVHTLTNGNLLQNADSGPSGDGARLTIPLTDIYPDGELHENKSVDVPFVICLKELSPFVFLVDVLGEKKIELR